jgi:hypothetical protein
MCAPPSAGKSESIARDKDKIFPRSQRKVKVNGNIPSYRENNIQIQRQKRGSFRLIPKRRKTPRRHK